MRKNNLILVFTIFLCAGIFAEHGYAQKTATVNPVKDETPQKTANTSVVAQYLSFSGLGMLEMQRMFRSLSPESRAAVMKFHIAFQFVKRPGLTADQKSLLLDSLSMITADSYSDTDTAKREAAEETAVLLDRRAKALFEGRERFEIFANLGPNPGDIPILQKYRDLISVSTMAERRSEFRKLSPVDKSNGWKIQIAVHLAQDMNLTKEQQEFFLRSFDFIKAEMYSIQTDSPRRSELETLLQKFTSEAIELFGKKEVATVFAKIGDEPKTETGPSTEIINRPKCNCSHDSDLCWTRCSGNSCDKQSYCGVFWAWECTGTCLET